MPVSRLALGTRRREPLHPLSAGSTQPRVAVESLPVLEQHDCVFIWHQPDGKEPQWQMPDIFTSFPQFDADPAAYYRPYPEFSRLAEREPVHPQIVAENGPDSAHFRYVHRATVTPQMLDWNIVDQEWRFLTGWPNTSGGDPGRMALRIHSHMFGLGGAISAFEGSSNHLLIFACTPVDDEFSNLFYSIWWPRNPGDNSDVPPDAVRERVERHRLITVWDDLNIWRYQKYVENPALSKADAKPHMALRKWAAQFYDRGPGGEVAATA